MSAETGVAIGALKWLWSAVFIPVFAMLWSSHKKEKARMEEAMQERYTKDETKEQIELRLTPLRDELRRNEEALKENTEVNKELSHAVNDLRVQLAKKDSE